MFNKAYVILTAVTLTFKSTLADTTGAFPICEAHGVDFQSDATYFQNASSPEDFTFVSVFENCQDDIAYNILVDPNGDEYFCADVPMQPNDTNQVSTCPIQKNQMFSGPWGLIITSNNGDDGAEPIAYQRDFNLVVGTPTTTTYTPTLTVTSTTTPISSVVQTTAITKTVTSTRTVTQPFVIKKLWTIIVPPVYTTTKTWTLGTIRKTSYVISPIISTKTITQQCTTSTQNVVDPLLTWIPSLLPAQVAASVKPLILAQALAAPSVSASAYATPTLTPPSYKLRKSPMLRRVPADREARIASRKERLARVAPLQARGIDQASITITETNTQSWSTATSTFTASASTITSTTVITKFTTTTVTNTVHKGTTVQALFTVTLATPTFIDRKFTVITQVVATVTKTPRFTVTTRTAPASVTAICTRRGGRLIG